MNGRTATLLGKVATARKLLPAEHRALKREWRQAARHERTRLRRAFRREMQGNE